MTDNRWQIVAPDRRDRVPLLVVVSLYVLSCLLPAGRTPGSGAGNWENTYLGGVLLLNGFTWICGCLPAYTAENLWEGRQAKVGELFATTLVNWPSWLANPFFWCGVWQFRKGRHLYASILASTAALLAALFFGSQWIWEQSIWEFPAYYCWAASPLVLAAFGIRRSFFVSG